jgi:NAD(P)-dependent dehydrogenase (short-subunit alcohol dehydrogenase family)
VLVTGGAAGIGEGISRRLAKAGYAVTIGDITVEEGERLAHEIGGDFVKLDVSDHEQIEEAIAGIVKKHGSLDALVNNAAVPPEAARYLTQALAPMPAPPEFGSFGFRDASMDSLRHVGHLP